MKLLNLDYYEKIFNFDVIIECQKDKKLVERKRCLQKLNRDIINDNNEFHLEFILIKFNQIKNKKIERIIKLQIKKISFKKNKFFSSC